MAVTWAFLAESAATVDNKLNVSGGVLSRYTVGPERVARPGFAFFDVEVNLPVDGRWLILVSGGSGTISIPLVIGQDDEAASE